MRWNGCLQTFNHTFNNTSKHARLLDCGPRCELGDLRPVVPGAHEPRILQLGLKFDF